MGFLTNARRGAMRSKTQGVFYRDLDRWPGPQKVQFRKITGYPEVVWLILALLTCTVHKFVTSTVHGGKFDSNLCCFTYSYICISFTLLRNWSSLMTCLGRRLAHFRAQWGKILYELVLECFKILRF